MRVDEGGRSFMAQVPAGPAAGEMVFIGGDDVHAFRLLFTRCGGLSNITIRTAPKVPGRVEKVQVSL
jgi:hypothetical protein